MSSIYLKSLRLVLAFIGFMLGFTSKVLAQYGAPVDLYRINVNILSAECNEPLKDISVKIEDPSVGNTYELKSDENGHLFVSGESNWGNNKLLFTFKDNDGPLNRGSFKTLESTYHLDRHNRRNDSLNVVLEYEGTPPCLSEDTNTPIDENPNQDILATTPELTSVNNQDEIQIANIPEIFDFIVFPNPSNGIFTVRFEIGEAMPLDIKIFDMQGKLILQEHFLASSGQLERSFDMQAAKGHYLIQISGNNLILSKKIIIS
ncbi:MAG: T9SS type A sorting domain-containing protein [Bacteroidales bacterium]|nr:T9SS type A sorting domain-containing protein [Bacteroidales bacterium]